MTYLQINSYPKMSGITTHSTGARTGSIHSRRFSPTAAKADAGRAA